MAGLGHDAESRLPDAIEKALIAVEQDREEVRLARRQWAAEELALDPDRFIFVDET